MVVRHKSKTSLATMKGTLFTKDLVPSTPFAVVHARTRGKLIRRGTVSDARVRWENNDITNGTSGSRVRCRGIRD